MDKNISKEWGVVIFKTTDEDKILVGIRDNEKGLSADIAYTPSTKCSIGYLNNGDRYLVSINDNSYSVIGEDNKYELIKSDNSKILKSYLGVYYYRNSGDDDIDYHFDDTFLKLDKDVFDNVVKNNFNYLKEVYEALDNSDIDTAVSKFFNREISITKMEVK